MGELLSKSWEIVIGMQFVMWGITAIMVRAHQGQQGLLDSYSMLNLRSRC